MATNSGANTFSVAFKINNKTTTFLIDTGAAVSIIPLYTAVSLNTIIHPCEIKLNAVDGHDITIHGETKLRLCHRHLRREFSWTFIVADASVPIIGADFLSHFALLVDCKKSRLIDQETSLSISCVSTISMDTDMIATTPKLSLPPSLPFTVAESLQKYGALLTSHQFNCTNYKDTSNQIYHHIETTSDRPVFAKVRQLPPEKFDIAKKEFDEMLDSGIIRPSKSPWASPLHMVPKPGQNKW